MNQEDSEQNEDDGTGLNQPCESFVDKNLYSFDVLGVSVAQWLGRLTSDLAVMGSIPGPRTIGHLGQLSRPSIRVGKSSTSHRRPGLRRGVLAYVGLQEKL